MAAITNLVLKNHADANVTYAPKSVQGGRSATWVDRTNSAIREQSTASLTHSESKTVRRVNGKVVFPKVSPEGTVDTGTARLEFVIPFQLTAQDRLDLCKRTQAFIAHAILGPAVVDGELPW